MMTIHQEQTALLHMDILSAHYKPLSVQQYKTCTVYSMRRLRAQEVYITCALRVHAFLSPYILLVYSYIFQVLQCCCALQEL